MLVRLKPYDPRKRHVMRKFTHGPTNSRFEEHMGWYRVSASLAEELALVLEIRSDESSPRAFDVCTQAQANAIDQRERRVRLRADSDDPNDLTSEDLHRRDASSMRRRANEAIEPPQGKHTPEPTKPAPVAKRYSDDPDKEKADRKFTGRGGIESGDEDDEEKSTTSPPDDPFEGVDDVSTDLAVMKAQAALEAAKVRAAAKAAKKAKKGAQATA